jgi:hypothetical protein
MMPPPPNPAAASAGIAMTAGAATASKPVVAAAAVTALRVRLGVLPLLPAILRSIEISSYELEKVGRLIDDLRVDVDVIALQQGMRCCRGGAQDFVTHQVAEE